MEDLYRYRAYTLIDVTNTGITTYSSKQEKQRNQQRNWETVYQVLSLRAQLMEFASPDILTDNVKKYNFGKNYTGTHKIWTFEFGVEHADIYALADDSCGTLKDDFKVTPVILGLDETAKPSIPMFYATGPDKNIYFITQQSRVNTI